MIPNHLSVRAYLPPTHGVCVPYHGPMEYSPLDIGVPPSPPDIGGSTLHPTGSDIWWMDLELGGTPTRSDIWWMNLELGSTPSRSDTWWMDLELDYY